MRRASRGEETAAYCFVFATGRWEGVSPPSHDARGSEGQGRQVSAAQVPADETVRLSGGGCSW